MPVVVRAKIVGFQRIVQTTDIVQVSETSFESFAVYNVPGSIS